MMGRWRAATYLYNVTHSPSIKPAIPKTVLDKFSVYKWRILKEDFESLPILFQVPSKYGPAPQKSSFLFPASSTNASARSASFASSWRLVLVIGVNIYVRIVLSNGRKVVCDNMSSSFQLRSRPEISNVGKNNLRCKKSKWNCPHSYSGRVTWGSWYLHAA